MSLGDPTTKLASELRAALPSMLAVLHALARGDDGPRVASTFAEDHLVGALGAAIDGMADALVRSRADRLRSERELEARLDLIARQRRAIAELSTPVIEVWSGVLTLPVLGTVDSERAGRMTRELLDAVVAREASLVVLDVTGVEVVDTSVADQLLRMARAVRLLGADAVLSGVRPAVARTIVTMGIEVDEVRSFSSLRAALQHGASQLAARKERPTSRRA